MVPKKHHHVLPFRDVILNEFRPNRFIQDYICQCNSQDPRASNLPRCLPLLPAAFTGIFAASTLSQRQETPSANRDPQARSDEISKLTQYLDPSTSPSTPTNPSRTYPSMDPRLRPPTGSGPDTMLEFGVRPSEHPHLFVSNK